MNKEFYKYWVGVFVFLLSMDVFGQTRISGTVTDQGTGETVPGATVLVKGTTNGTVTDIEGKYSLEVADANAILTVSFIGYSGIEVPISGRSTVDIALEVDITELTEVVVIGYGTQKKKVVTGAIASINSKEINSTPSLRVEQALQGRTPGVQVTNLSGQPGESPTVRIRGAGTTGNADPLYVVDGFVVGGIDYLNPGDIESIDVLKDAASAAIYGARAANGVVLITTKSGKEGKMTVSYSGYYGVQNVANTVDMLNADEYKMIQNEGARNANQTEVFDLDEIPAHDTNWQDELFQDNVPISNHQITVSGGNDKSTFTSSVSKFSQQGIIGGDKSQFDRYTARLNSSHKVNVMFNFGNNLAYSHIVRRGIGSNQNFNGPLSSAMNLDPLTPVFETDADILSQPPYSNNPVLTDRNGNVYAISPRIQAEVVNPLAIIENANPETRVDKFVGNWFAEFLPIEGLRIRSSLGTDLAFVLNDSYTPLFYLNGSQSNIEKTSVFKGIDRYFNWQFENLISYSKKIDNHNFSGLIGTTAWQGNFENLTGSNSIVPVDDPDNVYLNLAADTAWRAGGGADQQALASIFARVTYDFSDKYLFTAIMRRDGSSKFGSNKRWGNFPSIGLGWVISDEVFFSPISFINLLKLRGSWGVNGNQEIGNYQFLTTLDQSQGYTFGAGRVIGASPSRLANADVAWEESEQLDIALDYGLFGNQLTGSIDYYVKKTKGLLQNIPIPFYTGLDGSFANVGTVENKGIELAINWRATAGELNYSVSLNGAYNFNEMTHIGSGEGDVINGGSWAVSGPVARAEAGRPIGYFWGYKTDGIFQNESEVDRHIATSGDNSGNQLQPRAVPGDVRFVDVNNDGIIDDLDRTIIGNPIPDVTFGATFSADYKGFDFSMLISGSYGNDIFNGSQRRDLQFTNRTKAILGRWTGEGSTNEMPRVTWTDTNNNNRVSDLYIEDGSFARIKNMQIGYSLPEKVREKFGSSRFRIYASAENLLTFTNYSGIEPEIGAFNPLDQGIDRAVYPHSRTFRFGVEVGF